LDANCAIAYQSRVNSRVLFLLSASPVGNPKDTRLRGDRRLVKAMRSTAFFRALIAFSFDVGGVLAGAIVAFQLGVFRLSPWALAVYPAVLGAKRVIDGLLSGRVGTALHLGTAYPRFLGNAPSFYKLIEAMVPLTFLASIAVGSVSAVFGSFLWGLTLIDFSDVLAVVMGTMLMGLSTTFLAASLSFAAFKKGVDPDTVAYPVMSTTADILITVFYVIALNSLLTMGIAGRYVVYAAALLLAILAAYILVRNARDRRFAKAVKGPLTMLVLMAVLVSLTGAVLKGISMVIQNGKEVYTAYPALIDTARGVGVIVGSTATGKLALGFLRPSFSSMRDHATTIFSVWPASAMVTAAVSVLSLSLSQMLSMGSFLAFTLILLAANVIAIPVIAVLSFGFAILTFRRGLDRDSFVLPLASSLADCVMSAALLVSLVLLG